MHTLRLKCRGLPTPTIILEAQLPQNYGQYKQDPQDRLHLNFTDQPSLGYNIRGSSSYPPPVSSIGGYQNSATTARAIAVGC